MSDGIRTKHTPENDFADYATPPIQNPHKDQTPQGLSDGARVTLCADDGQDLTPCEQTKDTVSHTECAEIVHTPCGTAPVPPDDLACVMNAWPRLPDAVKARVVAMVKAAGGPGDRGGK